jgi:hypothetical protein
VLVVLVCAQAASAPGSAGCRRGAQRLSPHSRRRRPQALVAMLGQGISAFGQLLTSQSFMVPSALPCLVGLSRSLLPLAKLTLFTPRLVGWGGGWRVASDEVGAWVLGAAIRYSRLTRPRRPT